MGAFHGCQCFRAKSTISHLTSRVSVYNVIILCGSATERVLTTVLGEHSRLRESTKGPKEAPGEQKVTREQRTKTLELARELFKQTLLCNTRRLLLTKKKLPLLRRKILKVMPFSYLAVS